MGKKAHNFVRRLFRGGLMVAGAVTVWEMTRVVSSVLGGVVGYAAHVYVREGSVIADKIRKTCREVLRKAARLPRLPHMRTAAMMTMFGIAPPRIDRLRNTVLSLIII